VRVPAYPGHTSATSRRHALTSTNSSWLARSKGTIAIGATNSGLATGEPLASAEELQAAEEAVAAARLEAGQPGEEDKLADCLVYLGALLTGEGQTERGFRALEEAAKRQADAVVRFRSPTRLLNLVGTLNLLRANSYVQNHPDVAEEVAKKTLSAGYWLAVADPAGQVRHALRLFDEVAAGLPQEPETAKLDVGNLRWTMELRWWLASLNPSGYKPRAAAKDGAADPYSSSIALAHELSRLALRLFSLGHNDKAEASARQALAIYRLELPRNKEQAGDYARTLNMLGDHLEHRGGADEVQAINDEITALLTRYSPGLPSELARQYVISLLRQGRTCSRQSDFDAAAGFTQQAIAILDATAVSDHRLRGNALHAHGEYQAARGDTATAVDSFERAAHDYRAQESTDRLDDERMAYLLQDLAEARWEVNEYGPALKAITEAVDTRIELETVDPAQIEVSKLPRSITRQAEMQFMIGNVQAAAQSVRRLLKVLNRYDRNNDELNDRRAEALQLAAFYEAIIGLDSSVDAAREAADIYWAGTDADPDRYGARVIQATQVLPALLGQFSQPNEAAEAAADYLRAVRRFPDDPRGEVQALSTYGTWLAEAGRAEEAMVAFREGIAKSEFIDLAYPPFLWDQLTDLLTDLGRMAEADQAREGAWRAREAAPSELLFTAEAAERSVITANALIRVGNLQPAVAYLEQAASIYRGIAGTDLVSQRAEVLFALAELLVSNGRLLGSVHASREAIELVRNDPEFHPRLASCYTNLSVHLAYLGHSAEGVTAARASVDIRRDLLAQDPADMDLQAQLARSLANLVGRLYETSQHHEGVQVAAESVAMRRVLAEADHRYRLPLATSLVGLAYVTAAAGDVSADALASADEVIEICTADIYADDPAALAELDKARRLIAEINQD
jgi:hypothetical protein